MLLTTANVLGLANWSTFMLKASGTASSGGVGRHFQQERSSIYKMVERRICKEKSGMGSRVRLVVEVLTTLPLLNNVVQLLTTFTQGPHDFPSPPAFLFFFFSPSRNILFNLVHYS